MRAPQPPPSPSRNRLLAALPEAERERLLPSLELVELRFGELLIAPGDAVRHVHFPTSALISLVSLTEEGGEVEAGVVGCEGMLGVPAVLGVGSTPMRSVVQATGQALRAHAGVIKEEFSRGGALQDVLLRYVHALIVGIAQSAACNRLHCVEARLCRWLLLCGDCVGRSRPGGHAVG